MVEWAEMKPLILLACVLHAASVLASSASMLCVANDGHATYEWMDEKCCGESSPPAVAGCCGPCREAEESAPRFVAAPDCGGCLDALAPVPSGAGVTLPALTLPSADEVGAAGETVAARLRPAEASSADRSPRAMPLRC